MFIINLFILLQASAQGVLPAEPSLFHWSGEPQQIKVAARGGCAESYYCFGRADQIRIKDGGIENQQTIGCKGSAGYCPSAETCFHDKGGMIYVGPLTPTSPQGIDSPKGKDWKWSSTPEQFLVKKSDACAELGVCYGPVQSIVSAETKKFAVCPAENINKCSSPDDCGKPGKIVQYSGKVKATPTVTVKTMKLEDGADALRD
jgi:hypothetical protein